MKKLFSLFCMLFSVSAYAVDISSGHHEVSSVIAYSKQDPVNPDRAGFVQVYLVGLTWSKSTNCNTGDVLIRNEDEHLVSTVFMAYAANHTIRVYADDAQIGPGNKCIVRLVQVKRS